MLKGGGHPFLASSTSTRFEMSNVRRARKNDDISDTLRPVGAHRGKQKKLWAVRATRPRTTLRPPHVPFQAVSLVLGDHRGSFKYFLEISLGPRNSQCRHVSLGYRKVGRKRQTMMHYKYRLLNRTWLARSS